MSGQTCDCVKKHVPIYAEIDKHHVLPVSWGGTDTSPSTVGPNNNVIYRCPTGHHNIHFCLNEYVRWHGAPPASVLAKYTADARKWAAVAWLNRGAVTPFTVSHIGIYGEDEHQ